MPTTRYALFGVAAGERELWKEQVLLSNATNAQVEQVKVIAARDGWHHLREIRLDNAVPNFAATVNA